MFSKDQEINDKFNMIMANIFLLLHYKHIIENSEDKIYIINTAEGTELEKALGFSADLIGNKAFDLEDIEKAIKYYKNMLDNL